MVQVEVPPAMVVKLDLESKPMATPALVLVEKVKDGDDPATACARPETVMM
jgi:hypothetical protein